MFLQPKYKCALQHTDVVKIVTPDWIIDSINTGKILPEHDYHPSNLSLRTGNSHAHIDEDDASNVEVKVDQSRASSDPSARVSDDPSSPLLKPKEHVFDNRNPPDLPGVGFKQATAEKGRSPCVSSQPSPKSSSLERRGEQSSLGTEHTSALEQLLAEGAEMNSLPRSDETTTTITTTCPEETPPTKDRSISNKPYNDENVTHPSQKNTSNQSSIMLQDIVVCFSDYQDCMEKETIDKWMQVCRQGNMYLLQ